MTTVVMECSYRVCASASTLRAVAAAAVAVASRSFTAPVEHSAAVLDAESTLLRRQWAYGNSQLDTQTTDLEVWDLAFAFRGSARQVTASRLESLSRDLLRILEPRNLDVADSEGGGENVPWILTLNTHPDAHGVAAIVDRHPQLATAVGEFA